MKKSSTLLSEPTARSRKNTIFDSEYIYATTAVINYGTYTVSTYEFTAGYDYHTFHTFFQSLNTQLYLNTEYPGRKLLKLPVCTCNYDFNVFCRIEIQTDSINLMNTYPYTCSLNANIISWVPSVFSQSWSFLFITVCNGMPKFQEYCIIYFWKHFEYHI